MQLYLPHSSCNDSRASTESGCIQAAIQRSADSAYVRLHAGECETSKLTIEVQYEHADVNSLFFLSLPPPSLQESGELSKLVQKAREKLTIFSRDPSLQGLARLWLQLLTEPTETQVYGERSAVKSQTATNFSPTHA